MKKETIIITSIAGVALLALGYIKREFITRNFRKLKTSVTEKLSHTSESSREIPQEAD